MAGNIEESGVMELKTKTFEMLEGGGVSTTTPEDDARLLEAVAEWLKKEENQKFTVQGMAFNWGFTDEQEPRARLSLTVYFTEGLKG